jgi:hypothetical protein
LRFQRIHNISGLSKDGQRPWWYGDDNADRNVENTCCAVHSLVDISSAVWAAWPLAVRAQQHKMLRVGFVGMQPRQAPHYANFLKRMAEFGYQEGRNFTFDYIQTPDVEGYDRNYRELAGHNIDVFPFAVLERPLAQRS